MNRFLFCFLIIVVSCKGDRSEEVGDGEIDIIFHDDGRISVYFGEDNFKIKQASQLNSEGISLAKNGYFKKAHRKFQNGLELEPENPTLLNNLGNTEHELKNYHKAITYFERSLKVSDSLYLNASLNLGLLYWKDYEFEKSAKVLEYVLSKSDNKYEQASANYQLAKTYLDMNVCGKAQKAFSKAKLIWKGFSGFDKRLQNLEVEIKNCVQHKL